MLGVPQPEEDEQGLSLTYTEAGFQGRITKGKRTSPKAFLGSTSLTNFLI